jgi:hypothetical protein
MNREARSSKLEARSSKLEARRSVCVCALCFVHHASMQDQQRHERWCIARRLRTCASEGSHRISKKARHGGIANVVTQMPVGFLLSPNTNSAAIGCLACSASAVTAPNRHASSYRHFGLTDAWGSLTDATWVDAGKLSGRCPLLEHAVEQHAGLGAADATGCACALDAAAPLARQIG